MITIFSTFKPFRGHIDVIQRNAVQSWTRLRPRPEILIFGDEDGAASVAKEHGLQHVPEIGRSEHGAPLVSDLFTQAEGLAHNNTLCYVNADIVLMGDFMAAVQRVAARESNFLMIGQRWDLEIDELIDFVPEWEQLLRERVARQGVLHAPTGIDYFVFAKGLWPSLPPYAIGRVGYDNWLVYEATRRRATVVDASTATMVVHQNHDYAHLPGGGSGIQQSPDAVHNLALLGHDRYMYTIEDAKWLLTPHGLAPALSSDRLLLRGWRWLQHRTTLKVVLRWFWPGKLPVRGKVARAMANRSRRERG